MRIVTNPSPSEIAGLIKRPQFKGDELFGAVREILRKVQSEGDRALFEFAKRFDKVELGTLKVSAAEFEAAEKDLAPELLAAIKVAESTIGKFHEAQHRSELRVETIAGVNCWRRAIPIERVGLYIPGGSAPLLSTMLMLGVPARLAGCKEIVVCTPPQADGKIAGAILVIAKLLGITQVFKVGGAQAIGALGYGTETIPQVDKILGPGNQYVTAAKQLLQLEGVAIDIPAGPSEVCVVADGGASPEFIAADLLSQAEHGPDSQVLFITWETEIVEKVAAEVERQLAQLPRKDLAKQSIAASCIVLVENADVAMTVANRYAPEHLILAVSEPFKLAEKVQHAGSVFLGYLTPESLGDYASGTNHVLPTAGAARGWSGVSLDSFFKQVTFQQASAEGIENLSSAVAVLARAEGLEGHARAVEVRRRK